MIIVRYVLVDPSGTEHDEYEYADPHAAAEVATMLGYFVRIRYYDQRAEDLPMWADWTIAAITLAAFVGICCLLF
jgi:hypothetical protein